jgi:hypothetical protein
MCGALFSVLLAGAFVMSAALGHHVEIRVH